MALVSDVTFRKMRFDIDESVPFQWNAANPASGLMSNVISFFAVGFERYIVLAAKDALRIIEDADLRAGARVFLAQEAQHSAAHRKHVNALIAQYPALGTTLDRVIAAYEDLYAAKPLKSHLAYIASLEATFPPLFTFMIEKRDLLYHGDCRVASLFLWHYIEEIEHRSSADIIFDGVVHSRWYRLRTLVTSMTHVGQIARLITEGIGAAVPADDIGVPPDAATMDMWRTELLAHLPVVSRFFHTGYPTLFRDVSGRRLVKLVAGLVRSQLPTHHPADVEVPGWFHTWMASHAAGEDMAHYCARSPCVRCGSCRCRTARPSRGSRSCACWGPGGWGRYISPNIRGCHARTRSNCCPRNGRPMRSTGTGSVGKLIWRRSCGVRTSWACTIGVRPTANSGSPWTSSTGSTQGGS